GKQQELFLGDTTAKRDWGHSKDYVRGMWMVMQHSTPEDFIFATGKLHSVQEVVEISFATLDLDWKSHVRKDSRLIRPTESQSLVGDPAKAQSVLGWEREYRFDDMIREMTMAELEALKAER